MQIVVLNYSTAEVDVISYDSADDNDSVEEYLSEECGYKMGDISYMSADEIKITVK